MLESIREREADIESVKDILKLTEQRVLDTTRLELSRSGQHARRLVSRCGSWVDRVIGLSAIICRFISDRFVDGRERLLLLACGDERLTLLGRLFAHAIGLLLASTVADHLDLRLGDRVAEVLRRLALLVYQL